MKPVLKCLIILLSIALAQGADKDKFTVGPAASYPARQTMDKITVAAIPYDTEEKAHTAFGKLNPNQYGVLPVLVVIQNDTGGAIKLDLEAQYVNPTSGHIDATPARDVPYLTGAKRPSMAPSPIPIPLPRNKKGPLNVWEIEGLAFAAKMLPPGDSAHGFFYFQTAHKPGGRLYLNGIRDAATGKEFFYFEIPLDKEP